MSQHTPRRIAGLLGGLIAYGVGIALLVRGALGVAPWDVLTQGVARVSGLEFGPVVFLVSLVILLLWIPLRQRPGIGTVLNVIIVPIAAQATLWLIPVLGDEWLWLRVLLALAGILTVGIATSMYIGAEYGPGPRDGLMTGLHARTGWPIWLVRTGIEIVVVLTGWLLGGNLGLGTLAFALLIGPIIQATMPWFRRRPAARPIATPTGPPTGPIKTVTT